MLDNIMNQVYSRIMKKSKREHPEKKNTFLCNKCKEYKDLSEFVVNNRSKDGVDTWCKKCKSDYSKKHYNGLVGVLKENSCCVCGIVFISLGSKKLCSEECRVERKRLMQLERRNRAPKTEKRVCLECGKEFNASLGRLYHVYCSRDCNRKHYYYKHGIRRFRKFYS